MSLSQLIIAGNWLLEGDFKNKKVLVRCDYNVAIEPGGTFTWQSTYTHYTLPPAR